MHMLRRHFQPFKRQTNKHGKKSHSTARIKFFLLLCFCKISSKKPPNSSRAFIKSEKAIMETNSVESILSYLSLGFSSTKRLQLRSEPRSAQLRAGLALRHFVISNTKLPEESKSGPLVPSFSSWKAGIWEMLAEHLQGNQDFWSPSQVDQCQHPTYSNKLRGSWRGDGT